MRLLTLLLLAGSAFAGTNFSDVTGWGGTFQSEAHSAGVYKVESWDFHHLTTGTIRADKWDNLRRVWAGKLQAKVKINNWRKIDGDDYKQVDTWTLESDIERPVVIRPSLDWKTYSVEIVNDLFNPRAPTIYVDGVKVERHINGNLMTSSTGQLRWFPTSANMAFPFPAQGSVLQGDKSFPDTLPSPLIISTDSPPFPFSLTFELHPLGAAGLDVLISADNYESWRPEGGISEDIGGNSIKVRAKLISKDGSTPVIKVRRFQFDLVNVSSEPGICMNYPRQEDGPKRDPDLQFESTENPGLVLSGGTFKMSAATPVGLYTEASATVSSFDWGGVGTVRVVAELEDGRTLVGHPEWLPEGSGLRLPKTKDGSMIPEAWLKANNAQDKPDDADDDEEPVGDGHGGDGLTLYEEYRGFYENRVHFDGDPHRKDLIIFDSIGDRTLAGLAVFRLATGLAVHSNLAGDEMPKSRIVNANYADGAHVVDQHGDILVSADVPFSVAYSKTNLPPGPPKNTDLVMIPENPGIGSPAGQRQVLDFYDKAIAHELLHTTGVWHHGEGDTKEQVVLAFPGYSGTNVLDMTGGLFFNLSGPVFVAGTNRENSRIITMLAENGVDVGQTAIDLLTPHFNDPDLRYSVQTRHFVLLGDFYIGEKNGQHSGAERCLMRYEFAKAYRKNGDPNTFYLANDNPAGDVLCTSAAGTGINSPDHTPQSRHGDAAQNRGDCTHQLCVNDRIDHPAR